MPAAKKPTSATRNRAAAKEPPALRRLNKSLDTAQEALSALRNDLSTDVSKGARDLYGDVQKFVTDARRDSGKLGKALQKDVGQAERRLARSARTASARGGSARRSTAPPGAGRSTAKRGSSR